MRCHLALVPLLLGSLLVACTGENPAGGACGNGVVDPGETCDDGIADGPGSCPKSCGAVVPCTRQVMTGSPETCDVACTEVPITSCGHGDGCCPPSCSAASDDDCSATCGNQVVDPKETCDGDCPSVCSPKDACHTAERHGYAETCTAVCIDSPITQCRSGDSCCPEGCTPNNDSDCKAKCGNGVKEPGELCDGDCPTACTDNDPCTVNVFKGSPSTCNAECVVESVAECVSGDGCCPTGCSETTDEDCKCKPVTCASEGAQCGTLPDGCGKQLTCPACKASETCTKNKCVANTSVPTGGPCSADGQCAGLNGNGKCINLPDWKDGYCMNACVYDNDCVSGGHCVEKSSFGKICLKNCNKDTDCRQGYRCDTNNLACIPTASGTGKIGDPCTGLWQCSGGTSGECLKELPGGYCTVLCLPGFTQCPTGTQCVGHPTLFGVCGKTCLLPQDCRTGYSCKAGVDPQHPFVLFCYP